jgi:hypothetical protein
MNEILNNLKGSNKTYLLLTGVLFACTLLLNFYTKIADCALIFTFLALTLNTISAIYGTKKATKSIILSVCTSLALLWNLEYYIKGELISGLVITSLFSILVSSFIGLSLLSRLRVRYNFYVRNFISLTAYAIVDGAIMAAFFINIFPAHRVLSIFIREVGYKSIYGFGIYASLLAISYLQKQLGKTARN